MYYIGNLSIQKPIDNSENKYHLNHSKDNNYLPEQNK